MNYLHLHLSDWSTNENTGGFRLESTTHPELTATQHYSKADIAAIIAVANACHVIVVPEIDMPGHMNAILQAESGLNVGLKDSDGNVSASDIDVSNPNARQLISDLLNECLPLFTNSPYWHLGGDETVNYNGVSSKTGLPLYPQLIAYARAKYGPGANGMDAFYDFANWADQIVRAHGKTMRMWADNAIADGTPNVNSDIIAEYWYGGRPQTAINAGHLVANESWDPTYYVYGGAQAERAVGVCSLH